MTLEFNISNKANIKIILNYIYIRNSKFDVNIILMNKTLNNQNSAT